MMHGDLLLLQDENAAVFPPKCVLKTLLDSAATGLKTLQNPQILAKEMLPKMAHPSLLKNADFLLLKTLKSAAVFPL